MNKLRFSKNDVDEIRNAFHDYISDKGISYEDSIFTTILEDSDFERGVSNKTMKRWLYPYEIQNKKNIENENDWKHLNKYVVTILNGLGDKINLNDLGEPKIIKINDAPKFDIAKQYIDFAETDYQKKAHWRLFYFSNESNTVRRGYITLTDNKDPKDTNKTDKNPTGCAEIKFIIGDKEIIRTSNYETDKRTVYFHIENALENFESKFPLAQMVFKRTKEHNFHIGQYLNTNPYKSTTSPGIPYCGTIIAIKNTGKITNQLYALISYLLWQKRFQENKFSFEYKEKKLLTDDVPENQQDYPKLVSIWFNLQTYVGTYACCFFDKEENEFKRSFLQITQDGRVNHFTNKRNIKPYYGIAKTFVSDSDQRDRLYINLDYTEDAQEYRVKIFLNTDAVSLVSTMPGNGFIWGKYAAFVSGNDMPFACAFCMRKITDLTKTQIRQVLGGGKKIAPDDPFEELNIVTDLDSSKRNIYADLKKIKALLESYAIWEYLKEDLEPLIKGID
ncbi:MAG: hypothetical protein ABI921_05740 [Panacibacter sp.]